MKNWKNVKFSIFATNSKNPVYIIQYIFKNIVSESLFFYWTDHFNPFALSLWFSIIENENFIIQLIRDITDKK